MMEHKNIARVMIAGTGSGCGKTTITCAVLKALMNKGLNLSSFKSGPDYIDPMFHSEVLGSASRNIDFFLCGVEVCKYLFAKNSNNYKDGISIIEGVMGFYDGVGGNTAVNSSWDISEQLDIPVVLVVNCKGVSLSAVAIIKGFLDFEKNNIKAVILNNISSGMYPVYKRSIESKLAVKVLGYMPNTSEFSIESRHLGLVTAKEIKTLQDKVTGLAKMAESTIDLEGLIEIARSANQLKYNKPDIKIKNYMDPGQSVRIGVAMDKAFCFYYRDSLDLLEEMGAKLVLFSPLEDKNLPTDLSGIILGGGYPELYADKLSQNKNMLNHIREAILSGTPTFAECGGFIYLGEKLEIGGKSFEMAGVIDMRSQMTEKLQNFGYVTLQSKTDSMLLNSGESANAHEFHYSSSDLEKMDLIAQKSNGKNWEVGFLRKNVFAGYPHIHFWGNLEMAKKFILNCKEHKKCSIS